MVKSGKSQEKRDIYLHPQYTKCENQPVNCCKLHYDDNDDVGDDSGDDGHGDGHGAFQYHIQELGKDDIMFYFILKLETWSTMRWGSMRWEKSGIPICGKIKQPLAKFRKPTYGVELSKYNINFVTWCSPCASDREDSLWLVISANMQ